MSMSPYLPLPGETPLAFEAFIYWFNLKEHKLKLVAEALDIHISTIKEWSSLFRWTDRFLQHKARLLGESAEVHVQAAKTQAADAIETENDDIKALEERIRRARALQQRLTDNYLLHHADKTRFHEITAHGNSIEKMEQDLFRRRSALASNRNPKHDAMAEEELLRVYG